MGKLSNIVFGIIVILMLIAVFIGLIYIGEMFLDNVRNIVK